MGQGVALTVQPLLQNLSPLPHRETTTAYRLLPYHPRPAKRRENMKHCQKASSSISMDVSGTQTCTCCGAAARRSSFRRMVLSGIRLESPCDCILASQLCSESLRAKRAGKASL